MYLTASLVGGIWTTFGEVFNDDAGLGDGDPSFDTENLAMVDSSPVWKIVFANGRVTVRPCDLVEPAPPDSRKVKDILPGSFVTQEGPPGIGSPLSDGFASGLCALNNSWSDTSQLQPSRRDFTTRSIVF